MRLPCLRLWCGAVRIVWRKVPVVQGSCRTPHDRSHRRAGCCACQPFPYVRCIEAPESDKARYVAHDAVAQFTILCRASNLAETPLASRAHRHLLRPSTNCYTLSDRNKPQSTPVRHLPLTIPRVRLRSRQWSVVSLGQNSDCQMTGHPRY